MFRGLLIFLFFTVSGVAVDGLPASSLQVVLVTARHWDSTSATVRLLEKRAGQWNSVGNPMDAVTGRSGMGWGLGLHRFAADGPVKREGDGRAPAGVFRFGPVFAKQAVKVNWPLVRIGPGTEGVDDPASRYYNQLVDRRKITRPDWKSSEKFAESPHYGLGIWVQHNPNAVPGAGSCIYLHEWVGKRAGTAGCTVLRLADLERLLRALNRGSDPVLIQMPEAVARVRFPLLFKNEL